jgi:hypothetical protein
MTAIQVHIPGDLDERLSTVTDDVESFIVHAIRNELARIGIASEEEIETTAVIDQPEEALSDEELRYYLNLPAYV